MRLDILERLTVLAAMPTRRLKTEWQREYRSNAPEGLTRDLLMRAIAYRIQERAGGGLTQTTKRTLRQLAQRSPGEGAAKAAQPLQTMIPGVRLVRNWGGKLHAVLVLENGFEYGGERFRSLSEIASRITGTHWSGPRFFGLRPAAKRQRAVEALEGGADGQV